ncbi:hypothetical protein DL93DRAFT_2143384 [Clavulina sp. PMI_390]|nr:hypothetical protein DL93DRAFT_2143384 [Clavulina sp. PMI_390]
MLLCTTLDTLPVELIASILSELDIPSLRAASETSAYLRAVASDPLLNPWRSPILRALIPPTHHSALVQDSLTNSLEPLKTLSVLSTVPRHNWLEILCFAPPEFILFDATLPNLSEQQWEAAFFRRFLPSWARIRKNKSWRSAFLKMLFSVQHRLTTNCTTSEAWTNYIMINRSGVTNSAAASSRQFNPQAIFNTFKASAGLTHLPTSVRILVRLADVRIFLFGIQHRKSQFLRNHIAEELLYPPGVHPPEPSTPLPLMRHPTPHPAHTFYPNFTPAVEPRVAWMNGSSDWRWFKTKFDDRVYGDRVEDGPPVLGSSEQEGDEDEELVWIGPALLVAQLFPTAMTDHHPSQSPDPNTPLELNPATFENNFLAGTNQPSGRWANIDWADLWALAPWLESRIERRVDGLGLGIE